MPKAKAEVMDLLSGPANDAQLRDVLLWVGRNMALLNVNGKVSDKFCVFCKYTKVRRWECRHDEIWGLMKPDAESSR